MLLPGLRVYAQVIHYVPLGDHGAENGAVHVLGQQQAYCQAVLHAHGETDRTARTGPVAMQATNQSAH